MTKEYFSTSPKTTQKIAQKILRTINSNLICLYGDLGAGKTVFVQGLGKAMGIKERITSPTFVLLKTYKIKSFQFPVSSFQFLVHLDCYRLNSEKDFKAMDLTELWQDQKNLVVIEWPEKIKKILPKKRLDIFFKIKGEKERKLTVRGA